ncbi:hypothetical protein BDA99DRAFT_505902 [Phascolomyces articulosus]|uniref:Zinc finger Mcm10/DnaG-type domain-containing protein n=1 Tax=Phascolomyces articulosus TaxID=60185 RepID=A0AAD5KCQ1_9FUNG|nr:hypothetical protein BDA99DRAFT_505902 [Phascolomyces articulosus]
MDNTSDKIIYKIQLLTQLRLKKGYISSPDLESIFMSNAFISMDQLTIHVNKFKSIRVGQKPSKEWGTVGVIDQVKTYPVQIEEQKEEQDSKNNKKKGNNKFCIARVSNMSGVYFHLFVFGKAYKEFKDKLQVARVISVLKPDIARSSDRTADIALYVDSYEQLLIIGESEDLVQCSQFIRPSKQCPAMLDGRTGTLCNYHIELACKASKNSRMELASGDGGLEVRYAKVSAAGKSGRSMYQLTQPERKLDREFTYVFEGRGAITSEGKELNTKHPKKNIEDLKKNEELAGFLKGKSDPGAEMIRKIIGIQEEKKPKSNGLSVEAMLKMGYNHKEVLTKDQSDKKVL